MKILVNRAALATALAVADSVVLSRTPKPVLTCVKLDAGMKDGTKILGITATDMEMAVHLTVTQIDLTSPGTVLIPAAKLAEIVNNSPHDALTIEADAEHVTIKDADSFYKVFTFGLDDFPPVDRFEGEADYSLPASTLKAMIRRVSYAVAKDMSRYAINGMMLERKGVLLNLVATDGFRISVAKESVESGKDVNAVLPKKAVALLEKILGADSDGTVHIQIKGSRLFARHVSNEGGSQTEISAALLEGNFPPYNDSIPKDSDKKATIDRDRFTSAVRRAALLTNKDSKGVRLSFAKNTLTIYGCAATMGESKIDLPIEYFGEPLEMGFKPNYLLDALKVADTQELVFEFKTFLKPCLMRFGTNLLCVVAATDLG